MTFGDPPPPPRRYLEEVGCSDTVLDMRSRRVRALLARGPPNPPAPQNPPGPGESLLVRRIEEQIQRWGGGGWGLLGGLGGI